MTEKSLQKPKTAAVICEIDPLHFGHRYLFQTAKEHADRLVCILSGNFVQRGEPALLDKWSRCRLALQNGADLVIELPLPWACAGAERFAAGGVALAGALGCVDELVFGSESADLARMEQAAEYLLSPEFSQALKDLPDNGETFARRREAVLTERLGPAAGEMLRSANDILGLEYVKALRAMGSSIAPRAVLRRGAGHDAAAGPGEFLSAGELRERLRAGESICGLAPESTVSLIEEQRAAGACPAGTACLERAILCKLKTMTAEELALLPDVSEGLENRLYRAARTARTLEELYGLVKTKRYTHARVRRLVMHAFLGVTVDLSALPPYLRVLGVSPAGEEILREASPAMPMVARPADLQKAGEEARRIFALEARADDLYAMACPAPQPCGRDHTEKLMKSP